MRSIDERIVDMQFNNKQFEDGIQTSLKSLDNLKKGLDDTGKGHSLGAIQSGVEVISDRFSALGIIGITALQNITNAAINTGKQLIKSLTIYPIMDGFNEYELKMGSIQTIMAGSGESLETVNKYLDELNIYADKTIYSFKDMTSSIGKFTNAGVKLEDAVAAIQGVSNVAALSGANADEASRAMYNFAQALSAGHVKLIDWKSIENANMATVEFKTQLLESAVAAGTLEKTADGMYKVLSTNAKGDTMDGVIDATHNFNDSLSYQWMTTDALVGTLSDYADETTEIGKKAFAAAQDVKTFSQMMDTLKEAVGSGWARTFEIIIGDFEEAKTLFTDINNVLSGMIDSASDARNELLQGWKDLGGRTALIESFKNIFEGLISVVTPIKEAFREIFPPTTAEKLFALTEGLKNFTEKLKIGDETSKNLKDTFKGLFALLDIGAQAFSFLFDKAGDLVGILLPGTGGILSFTASIGEFIVGLNNAIRTGDVFNRAFDTVKNAITTVANTVKEDIKGMMDTPAFQTLQDIISKSADKIKEAFNKIKEVFRGFGGIDLSGVKALVEGAEKNFKPFTALGEGLSVIFGGIQKVLEKFAPVFSRLASIFGTAFKSLSDAVSGAFKGGGFEGILDLINGGIFASILLGIKKFMESLTEVSDNAGGFIKGITGIFKGVRGCLEEYQTSLKANTLITIASAIAILAGALVVLSMIDGERLMGALGAISVLFVELSASMIVMQNSMGSSKMLKLSGNMTAMATAILILSVAMKSLAELDWDGIAKGSVGIGILMADTNIKIK